MGGAWSQAPDSLVLTANNLALDTWSLDAIRELKTTNNLGSSHAFWELASSGGVTGVGNFSPQIIIMYNYYTNSPVCYTYLHKYICTACMYY